MTRQQIGLSGADFAYRGSIGPISPGDVLRQPDQLDQIGRVLRRELGLMGLFGIDFVIQDRVAYVVEVNPRYTASAEVLELSLGRSLLAEHVQAFGVPWDPVQKSRRPAFVGKEILFATHRCRLPAVDSWNPRAGGSFATPPLADLPTNGFIFDAGEPILTVLARANSLDSCRKRLEQRLHRWQSRLIPVLD